MKSVTYLLDEYKLWPGFTPGYILLPVVLGWIRLLAGNGACIYI